MNANSLIISWLSGPWISQLSLHTHRRLRGLKHLSSHGLSGRESEHGLANEVLGVPRSCSQAVDQGLVLS